MFLWLGVSLFVISPFSVWAIAFGKGLTCRAKTKTYQRRHHVTWKLGPTCTNAFVLDLERETLK